MVLILAIIFALAAVGIAFFVWYRPHEDNELGYDNGAVVVTDEDELQKIIDDRKNKDGQISLEYKNVATSNDGREFSCFIANSAKNKYDMYLGIYKDASYQEELFLTQLLRPGSGIQSFTCSEALEPGTYDVVLVFTLVKEDHQTIKSQTSVAYTLTVRG